MKQFKTFDSAVESIPDGDAKHQIIWYIEKKLTFDEWVALDDGMEEVFERLGLSDDVIGIAGPIPFDD